MTGSAFSRIILTMFKFLLVFLLMVVVWAGCSTTLVREEPETIRVGEAGLPCAMAPLAEALLAQHGTTVSAVNGNWKDHVFSAECVLKGEEGRFTVVFLAPQMRLATLTITPPHTITFERARALPAAFEPEYALFDIAVVNLPANVLRKSLGTSFVVSETGATRTVLAHGVPVARRQKMPNGLVHYDNLSLGYSYDLKEVK